MAVSDISTRSFQIWFIPPQWDYKFVSQGKYCLLSSGIAGHIRKYLKELIYEEAKQQDAVYIGTTEQCLYVKHTSLHV